MDGRVKKAEDFLKTRLFDTLTEQMMKVTQVHTHFPQPCCKIHGHLFVSSKFDGRTLVLRNAAARV